MNEILRWRMDCVREALQTRRVVYISGSRQTGKTTLTRQVLSEKENSFKPLDLKMYFDAAKKDPTGFVQNNAGTMVIDEVQKVPELISEIKYVVDRDNRAGQYLLTGSANIQSLPTVTESLAGRVRNIRLRPLTQGEILGNKPTFLQRAFAGDLPTTIGGYDKETIFNIAFRGGFPEVVRLKTQKDRKLWWNDYLTALIQNDLRDVANIKRQDILRQLIEVLASWSGKYMDLTGICSRLGLSRQTLSSYINTLEVLYLFEKVPPWIKTDYDRVGHSYKIYATDTGLIASLLDWKLNQVLNDYNPANTDRAGKLIETLVFNELSAQIDLAGFSLYQYRDRENREIDFIIENDDGAILGIEVKASLSVSTHDFKPQIWFKNHLLKNERSYIGIVLYCGEKVLSFGDCMYAVPIAGLWS